MKKCGYCGSMTELNKCPSCGAIIDRDDGRVVERNIKNSSTLSHRYCGCCGAKIKRELLFHYWGQRYDRTTGKPMCAARYSCPNGEIDNIGRHDYSLLGPYIIGDDGRLRRCL